MTEIEQLDDLTELDMLGMTDEELADLACYQNILKELKLELHKIIEPIILNKVITKELIDELNLKIKELISGFSNKNLLFSDINIELAQCGPNTICIQVNDETSREFLEDLNDEQ